MSTKRTLPKDFDVPLQSKQPRLEVLPPVTASPSPTFVFPSRTLSLPLQGIPAVRTAIPPAHSPAALIGIPGILPTTSPLQPPGTPQFDFPAPQVSPSISLPAGLAGITPSPQTASSLNTFVATAAAIRGLQLPQSPVTLPGITALSPQFAPSPTAAISVSVIRPGAASTPIPSSLIAASPISTPTLLHATPPPPYYPTPTPIASTAEQSSDEFTCSSPSQFLHSPTSLRLPVTSLAAISTDSPLGSLHKDNRQPVCALPSRNVPHLGKNGSLKSKVLKYKKAKLAGTKLKYEVQLKEKFFLEGGGNMMEFVAWKRRANPPRDRYLRLHGLDSESSTYHDLLSPKEKGQSSKMDVSKDRSVSSDAQRTPQKHHKESKSPRTSSKASYLRSHSSTASPTRIQIPLSTVTPSLQVSGSSLTTPKSTPTSPARMLQLTTTPSPRPSLKSQASFSSVYESSHEDIVMRARHEAEVMRAISDLRKEGLWSASRLPKVREPSRRKTHWDYLLEEMQWLATDFANERRWKRNAAKKLCRSVARQYQEKDLHHVRTEKEELLRLRKIASTIAKEVKHFWDSIQKIVEHKHHVLLEEKRKKAMDMHLEFIVDQTAKYSNWLVKGLASKTPSEPSLQSVASYDDSDAFLTPVEESDDEETINIEEKQIEKEGTPDYMAEIKQLQEEGEIPLDQLLASLPPEMLEGNPLPSEQETTGVEEEMETEKSAVDEKPPPLEEAGPSGEAPVVGRVGEDVDYQMSESEGEDETTIAEQEEHETDVDPSTEVDALQKEGELPLEELLKLYNMEQRRSATPETDVEGETDIEGEASVREAEMETGEGGGSSSGEESAEEEEEDQGIELLVSGKSLEEACQTEEGLSNVAAAAEQFQPKGITLATTEVRTKVPFLLKHILREYQHIGLEWLVAMDERRLNGILADEMGLGKTIQTIALLGHLACEKANWGPHLIIVPTSVMLNWECEFKKWCPAFKILTYFGSLKERKQKRVGWSKRNAFHVCITSYNIAVQDHRAFKQKRWKYLVLDEAQNIKNFKSQRWQTLLNFNSQRRLLLTGTPLQNNLMELWSLMHFLMPMVFSSHTDFKEWFSNPLTGMVEGSQEYNESIVKRLHQVLRPFLLRRLKMEVEKQMPKKYEHVMMCRLSKRQRFLYDEYMSRTKTKDTLAGGNFLSVINILMQLRKVCNHPDLFEPRPILSSFRMAALEYYTASLALKALEYEPFKHVNLDYLNLHLADYELDTEAFVTFRLRQLQAPRAFITDPPIGPSLLTLGRETPSFLEDLHLPHLSSQRQEWTLSCRRHMHEVNTRRCRRQPMYGTDLVRLVRSVCSSNPALGKRSEPLLHPRHWQWSGHAACTHHQTCQLSWGSNCNPLRAALHNCEERIAALRDMIDRFIIVVPQTTAPGISLHVHHPSPSWALQQRQQSEQLARELSPRADFLHPIVTHTSFQFPETRLIQYDCGKLQTLDSLLRRLKAGTHRALIFTQMARMLDVLEIFLNYHGHTYLRLDGATPVQKRQVLMDRFNRDERVFCFILSTRSGGLGVNLTGADTVIFYDSDWNPTMDAQAQDRCHRIGQTRDVHIYRLVCDRTVEENILKKANQKRLLGDIAIEGGAFTTDFFKQVTLHDLFQQEEERVSSQTTGNGTSADKKDAAISERQIEEMLLQAEDDSDVQAAQMAKAEQAAEMAEFDENFSTQDPLLSREDQPPESEGSKALTEFAKIEEQLSGVERYAMKFLEAENAEFAAAQLRIAEENIELAKKDWELSHLQSLRKEEERLAEEEADDILLTYDRPETSNKMYVDEATGEEMPIWFPPTPPADDVEDIYVDIVLNMSYDISSTMSSTLLASIAMYSEDDYDVFGLLKQNMETEPLKRAHKTVMKQTKENVNVPPSLFWRRGAADSLSTKLRRLGTHQKKMKSKDQFTPILEQQPEGPTWTHFEDWALLKSVTNVLEYPLSLTISVPAQNPNWNIVADLTSTLSRVRRSPLQCREHVMSVVIPREDNTVKVDELEPKKYKSRDSTIKKSKSRRDQRTKNLILHDNGKELTKQFSHTFDWVTLASSKRRQAPKFTWEAVQKPSTHSNLLKDYGIDMDSVHSPTQIAVHRAERIQSELPRHSQMHQLLAAGQAQPYAHLSQITARAYPSGAASFMKPAITGYLPPRQPLVSVATTTQRFQPLSNSAVTFSPSKIVTTGVPTSLTIPTTTPTTLTSHPTSLPAVTKMSSAMTEIGKLAPFTTGGRLTQQQIYLLRQTALQHQQQQQQQQQQHPPQPPPQLPQTVQPPQTTQLLAAQKLALPGIEQLRPAAVALSQRFPSVTSATGTMRSITAATGRNLRTEEVLALLKQQSLHMAASQAYKAGPATTFQTTAPIQFRPEGGLQLAKPSTPSALPAQTEGVKVAPSPVSVESGQLKVEMVEQSQQQLQKPPQQQEQKPQQAPSKSEESSGTS